MKLELFKQLSTNMSPTMKKLKYFSLLLIIIFFTTTCKKEVEKFKETKRVEESQGLIIKPDQKFQSLENTNIASVVPKDTVTYENKKLPTFEITVTGSKADSINQGTIILDQTGLGSVYLVTEVPKVKSGNIYSSLTKVFKAIKAPLNLLFNYEGASIAFNSPENRAKKIAK